MRVFLQDRRCSRSWATKRHLADSGRLTVKAPLAGSSQNTSIANRIAPRRNQMNQLQSSWFVSTRSYLFSIVGRRPCRPRFARHGTERSSCDARSWRPCAAQPRAVRRTAGARRGGSAHACYRFRSPWSPCPALTLRFALLGRSAATDRSTRSFSLNRPFASLFA